jgi:hypothetical protein
VNEVGGHGKAVEYKDLHVGEDVEAAQVGEYTSQRARIEACVNPG